MTESALPALNDPLSANAGEAGTWANPGQPDTETPAQVPPSGFDYSGGMFVAPFADANALIEPHPLLFPARTDLDLHSYETPHEATHRRYEPPFTVAVNQAAAGFTLIAPPTNGLHYIKILGCYLTLDAAGTLRWVQGSMDGTNVAAMSGNLNLGGAATPPLALPIAEVQNPWHFTSPDQALGIFTVTGKAQGWVVCCNSPYDA